MKAKSTMVLALIAASLATGAAAQQAGTSESPTITSEPGRVKAVSTAEMSAKITAVDKPARRVTLQLSDGEAVDVVAGPEVQARRQRCRALPAGARAGAEKDEDRG